MAMSEDFESRAGHLRSELLVHCYQMLGSVHDAGDSVQETMLRASSRTRSRGPPTMTTGSWPKASGAPTSTSP